MFIISASKKVIRTYKWEKLHCMDRRPIGREALLISIGIALYRIGAVAEQDREIS